MRREEKPIQLDEYTLEEPIGYGGMAEVWRGVHRKRGLPVAVKVITGSSERDSEAIRYEIRAVARLDHPGIIGILDYGEVGSDAAEASQGKLVEEAPYMVMELANGGTLKDFNPPVAWPTALRVLLRLLDALSHAHARGVIHRDLKPSNILVFTNPENGRYRLKITDFGIAHALDPSEIEDQNSGGLGKRVAGSPVYMPPEQFNNAWRDYGPWTDLYSLGCVAYELASGKPPFGAAKAALLAFAHTVRQPPKLNSVGHWPKEFEDWVGQLLEKSPSCRFQTAADAAFRLTQIAGGGPLNQPIPSLLSIGSTPMANQAIRDDASAAASQLHSTTTHRLPWSARENVHEQDEELPTLSLAPQPADWRRQEVNGGEQRLESAGLRLYGLRQVPLIGREAERDLIWDTLAEVRKLGEPKLIVLRGPAGTGKTRLAEWISERALEVGAASFWRAGHGRNSGAGEGLPRMLAEQMGCIGLEPMEVLQRVQQQLAILGIDDEFEWTGLAEIISPSLVQSGTDRPSVIDDAAVRHSLISRYVSYRAARRPVILLLDDVQWGPEALAFCRQLLRGQPDRRVPVLLLLTVQTEALAEAAETRLALEKLLMLKHARALDLGPLQREDLESLVRNLLPLDDAVVAALEEHTRGNPLFAVQVVADWVSQELIEMRDGKLVATSPRSLPIPRTLQSVWAARVARLLDEESGWIDWAGTSFGSDTARIALELASLLGRRVEQRDWVEACKQAGIKVPNRLVDRLIARDLAHEQVGGWTFSHGLLRDSIEQSIDPEDLLWHHKSCADMILATRGSGDPQSAARLGRHLASAHCFEDALEPLLLGARYQINRGNPTTALSLLDRRDECLDRLATEAEELCRAPSWALRSRIYNFRFEFDEARSWADKLEAAARANQWTAWLAEAKTLLAWSVRQQGALADAANHAAEATTLYQQLGDPAGVAAATRSLAIIARQRGDLEAAKERYSNAKHLFEIVDDELGIANCNYGLSRVLQLSGDEEATRDTLTKARDQFAALGVRNEVANCVNFLAELNRHAGDLDEAEAGYRQAMALQESIGSGDARIARFNICVVQLVRGDFEDAHDMLSSLQRVLSDSSTSWLERYVRAALLASSAALDMWSGWESEARELASELESSGTVDPDIAWCTQRAGKLAMREKQVGCAKIALEIAVEQWGKLGNAAAQQANQKLLRTIG